MWCQTTILVSGKEGCNSGSRNNRGPHPKWTNNSCIRVGSKNTEWTSLIFFFPVQWVVKIGLLIQKLLYIYSIQGSFSLYSIYVWLDRWMYWSIVCSNYFGIQFFLIWFLQKSIYRVLCAVYAPAWRMSCILHPLVWSSTLFTINCTFWLLYFLQQMSYDNQKKMQNYIFAAKLCIKDQ